MQNRRSEGSFSRDALSPTGTTVLGDGAATGLVFVSRALLARVCDGALRASDLYTLAALEEIPSSAPHFQFCFIAALES